MQELLHFVAEITAVKDLAVAIKATIEDQWVEQADQHTVPVGLLLMRVVSEVRFVIVVTAVMAVAELLAPKIFTFQNS